MTSIPKDKPGLLVGLAVLLAAMALFPMPGLVLAASGEAATPALAGRGTALPFLASKADSENHALPSIQTSSDTTSSTPLVDSGTPGSAPAAASSLSPQPASTTCFPDAAHPLSPLGGYKDTYILPYAYDTIGSADRMHEEVKFQVSIRKELFHCDPAHLYFGYTQLSLWEFYQPANSRAFRTSDYNPELFVEIGTRWGSILPDKIQSGIEHQSNGAGGINERSWNRIYEQSFWKMPGNAATLALKLWWRIPEGPPASPSNPGGDDNPDIEDYLGIFELRGWWTFGPFHSFSAMYRRGYRDGTDTGELDYDVTIGTPASGVMARLQVFSGYGETLIDYNRRVDRFGIGFVFH